MIDRRRGLTLILVGVMLFGALLTRIPAMCIDLGSILKGAAAVLLTEKFSGEINDFINKATMNKGIAVKDQTKVVPIISVGQGVEAGAAQVSGPARLVDKVKVVAQIESNFKGVRIKILVPVESKDVLHNLKRVGGVGVSAVIDLKL